VLARDRHCPTNGLRLRLILSSLCVCVCMGPGAAAVATKPHGVHDARRPLGLCKAAGGRLPVKGQHRAAQAPATGSAARGCWPACARRGSGRLQVNSEPVSYQSHAQLTWPRRRHHRDWHWCRVQTLLRAASTPLPVAAAERARERGRGGEGDGEQRRGAEKNQRRAGIPEAGAGSCGH
jgi:hypothetical protein